MKLVFIHPYPDKSPGPEYNEVYNVVKLITDMFIVIVPIGCALDFLQSIIYIKKCFFFSFKTCL